MSSSTPVDACVKSFAGWLIPVLLWTGVVALSAWWNVDDIKIHSTQMATQRGRDLFNLIELTRLWNAGHGGVYVLRSDKILPNPYLRVPNRDLTSTNGLKLTMVNPAYMTRQISELARSQGFRFHITSDRPLRPANKADAWESKAIASFVKGKKEVVTSVHGDEPYYRYMAPLFIKPTCLGCHAIQGYQLGEVRGGISIDIDARGIRAHAQADISRSLALHAITWLIVLAFMLAFLNKSRQRFLYQERVNREQSETITKTTTHLKETRQKLETVKNYDAVTGLHNRDFFDRRLAVETRTKQKSLGVMLVEIDLFGSYNEDNGLIEGDALLRAVAHTLETRFEKVDALISRYINASFAVLEKDTNAIKFQQHAEGLRRAIANLGMQHKNSSHDGVVTVSIGVCYVDAGEPRDAAGLIKAAAVAMNEARREGRNRVVLASNNRTSNPE
jgi:diguanylate cyclase (GGDEF)-like protein